VIKDTRGYTLLHEAVFQKASKCAEIILEAAREELNCDPAKMKLFVNCKTKDDGFTALHFAAFRGNIL